MNLVYPCTIPLREMIQFNNKPPKKLMVKNLKNKPKVSDEYEAAALARISSTIDSVFKDEVLPYGHEEIYRNCETLCKFHVAGQVYRILYEKCEVEAKASAATLIKECEEVMDEVEYLKKIERAWDSFQRHYSLLESLFLYLDKVYISQQQSASTSTSASSLTVSHNSHQFIHIKRFGINFFRSYYLMNSGMLGREMIEKLMILTERIRNEKISTGELFDLEKKLIKMIRELEEYSQGELEFEKLFIQRTWSFYEKESLEESSRASLPDYLKYASERLNFESEVICSLLAPISRDKLMKCVRERLILDRMKSFMFPKPTGSSLKNFFDSGDMSSIKLMYEMINSVFGVESLATEWTAFLRSHGQELMSKGNDYRTIEGVAEFKEQVDEIIRECFQNDPILQGTLKDAFETIMNGRGERSAELLALYVHQKLQSDATERDPIESESILSMALLLFRYLHRKEAFDTFYKRTLAQRLLFHGSKDLSLEKQFISMLRDECGGGFVSRMESMVKDVEQSPEMTRLFKKDDPAMNKGLSSVTGITVISGLWPTTYNSGAKLTTVPASMDKIKKDFNQFYTSQKKNCSLTWNEMMGNVVMRSTFFSTGRFNLNLTIPQALVLLQFNENDTCSFDKLLQGTKFENKLLDETLKSLSDPLYPLLMKSDADYKVNGEFEYKGTGKVPLYALQSPFLPVEEEISGLLLTGGEGESKTAEQGVSPSVIADRQGQVDALLVRRMKHQVRSNRKDLVNHILANLGNIRVSAGDVDTRIDELISKVFLQLDDEDQSTVIYVP